MLPRVAVVIATLGRDELNHAITLLNSGSVVPAEILVCVPDGRAVDARAIQHANVRIIVSEKKGQVAQRLAGFRQASCEYVLQMDDDMSVHPRCLERLLEGIAAHQGACAVAPSLVYTDTGESIYQTLYSSHPSWLDRLIHGPDVRSPGRVTRAGYNVPLALCGTGSGRYRVDWLPGGCVLHRRDFLVLEDYYPFLGKAYAEDVLHSIRLRRSGVELVLVCDARCGIDRPAPRGSARGFLRDIYFELRWRRHLVKVISGCFLCLLADVFIKYTRAVVPGTVNRFRRTARL